MILKMQGAVIESIRKKGRMFKVWSAFASERGWVKWPERLMNAPGFQLQSGQKESC